MPKSTILGASAALHTRQARQRDAEANRLARAFVQAMKHAVYQLSDEELQASRTGDASTNDAVMQHVLELDAAAQPDPALRIEALCARGEALVGEANFARHAFRVEAETPWPGPVPRRA